MSLDLQLIEARLAALPPMPWYIEEISSPDENVIVGALRTADNRNVVQPSVEAMSMIMAFKEVFEFLRDAPEIVSQLLTYIKQKESASKVNTEG
jgi:enolase